MKTNEDHNWKLYDETDVCLSEQTDFKEFEYSSLYTKVLEGIQSRPGNIVTADLVKDFALVP